MVTVPLGPAAVDMSGIRAGDRNLATVTVTSGGAPLDLTGYTITAQARASSIDEASVVDAVVEVVDAVAGQLTLRWPGDDVRAILAGADRFTGVWDLQLDDGSGGDPFTIAAGKWSADMDVTRP